MDEEFGSTFITIEDEDGNEFELEHLATAEYEGAEYMLFLPADMDEDDPDFGFIILKVEEVDGEDQFVSVDDEDELQRVYDYFMEKVFADEDDAFSDEDEDDDLEDDDFEDIED